MCRTRACDATTLYIVQWQLQTSVDVPTSGAVRLVPTNANTSEIAGLQANFPNYFWSSGRP
jgi:hypothetical protein